MEVTRHSRRHFRYRLQLERPLAADERQKIGFATELHGIAVPVTAYANTIDHDPHPVELTVAFETPRPEEV